MACRVSCFPCPPGAGGATLPNGTLVCYAYKWQTLDGHYPLEGQHCATGTMGTTQCKSGTLECYRRVQPAKDTKGPSRGPYYMVDEYFDVVNHAPRLTF